jgi:uncharacterized membrane protein YhaH (DUF805 family)
MFCSHCGTAADGTAANCLGCGVELQSQPRIVLNADRAVAASREAIRAVKLLLVDPVGSIGAAYDALGTRQATDAGIVFSAAFIMSCIFAIKMISRFSSGLLAFSIGIKEVLQVMLVAAVPVASLIAIFSAIQLATTKTHDLSRSMFAGGAALVPIALFNVAGSLLGAANGDVVALIGLYALCYTVLLLYAGCRAVLKSSSALSAAAVPLILIATAWLTKIILFATAS